MPSCILSRQVWTGSGTNQQTMTKVMDVASMMRLHLTETSPYYQTPSSLAGMEDTLPHCAGPCTTELEVTSSKWTARSQGLQ